MAALGVARGLGAGDESDPQKAARAPGSKGHADRASNRRDRRSGGRRAGERRRHDEELAESSPVTASRRPTPSTRRRRPTSSTAWSFRDRSARTRRDRRRGSAEPGRCASSTARELVVAHILMGGIMRRRGLRAAAAPPLGWPRELSATKPAGSRNRRSRKTTGACSGRRRRSAAPSTSTGSGAPASSTRANFRARRAREVADPVDDDSYKEDPPQPGEPT